MSKTLDVSKIMCERFHLIRLTEQHVQGGAEEMEPLFIRGGPWDRVHPIYALPPAGFTPPSSSSLHFLQTETCLIILLAFKPQISCNQICTESLVGWEKAEMLIDSWIHQVPPPPRSIGSIRSQLRRWPGPWSAPAGWCCCSCPSSASTWTSSSGRTACLWVSGRRSLREGRGGEGGRQQNCNDNDYCTFNTQVQQYMKFTS